MSSKFDIFVWSNDFQEFTGEGLLARTFIQNFFKNKNYKIRINSNFGDYIYYLNKFKLVGGKRLNKQTFITNYISPFLGIFLIWYYFFKGKKICYLNYLPLWNFFIFLLLPKKTILGPITGSLYYKKIENIESFIRKYLFRIFYFISLKIIFNKFYYLIFSTSNLKNLVNKKFKERCLFDFCYLFYKKRKKIKKNYDIVFYLRKHSQKSNKLQTNLINELALRNFKVIVIGDNFSNSLVDNFPNIRRNKIFKILDNTKFAFSSDDNLFSLFSLDCLSSNINVFFNKNYYDRKFRQFIPIYYNNNNIYDMVKKISESITNFKNSDNYDSDLFFRNKKKLINKRLLSIINYYL